MSHIIKLPNGQLKKTIAIGDVSVDLYDGQLFSNKNVISMFPQFFVENKNSTATPKVEEKLEILTEVPRQVEVEIVAVDTVDFEAMTVKELKAYAADKGIEITASKKKDIIAELA